MGIFLDWFVFVYATMVFCILFFTVFQIIKVKVISSDIESYILFLKLEKYLFFNKILLRLFGAGFVPFTMVVASYTLLKNDIIAVIFAYISLVVFLGTTVWTYFKYNEMKNSYIKDMEDLSLLTDRLRDAKELTKQFFSINNRYFQTYQIINYIYLIFIFIIIIFK